MRSQSEALGRDNLYHLAVAEFGGALDRLAAGYEADAEKRLDLRQEIHLQLWRSLELFDQRCSLKTWVFRVAHNTAASYVTRERRKRVVFVYIEDVEQTLPSPVAAPDFDHERALAQLSELILKLKPLDRQIMISYLEELDAATIGGITGLSPANVAMKIHRIKAILSRRFPREQHDA